MSSQGTSELKDQLTGLLETLNLLTAQTQAYERALPADNYQARAAVAIMGELARQALAEAQDLEAALMVSILPSHPFSPRELEVLTLVAEGLSNKEIAARLYMSETTVKSFLQQLFNKTGVRSRTQLVRVALWRRSLRTAEATHSGISSAPDAAAHLARDYGRNAGRDRIINVGRGGRSHGWRQAQP